MSTSTTNYGLLKPDPSENVNVTSQLNDNYDKIDTELAKVSFHPVARMRQETLQSIPNTTWTSVTLDAEDFDTHSAHSTSSNTSRFTCPASWGGYFWCDGNIWLAANTTGVRLTRWAKNGALVDNSGLELSVTPAGALWGGPLTGILIPLSPGDYIEMQVWQNSGGALNTAVGAGDETGSLMSVKWDRPL